MDLIALFFSVVIVPAVACEVLHIEQSPSLALDQLWLLCLVSNKTITVYTLLSEAVMIVLILCPTLSLTSRSFASGHVKFA